MNHFHWPPVSRVRMAVAAASLALLAACGGGGDGSTRLYESPAQIGNVRAASAALASVEKLTLIKQTRISRTVYEYVYRPVLRAGSTPLASVSIELTSAGQGTTIVDRFAYLDAAIAPGASATMADDIVVRHDRTLPFDMASLAFKVIGLGALQTDVSPQTVVRRMAFKPEVVRDDAQLALVAGSTNFVDAGARNWAVGTLLTHGGLGYRVTGTSVNVSGQTIVATELALLKDIYSDLAFNARVNPLFVGAPAKKTIQSSPNRESAKARTSADDTAAALFEGLLKYGGVPCLDKVPLEYETELSSDSDGGSHKIAGLSVNVVCKLSELIYPEAARGGNTGYAAILDSISIAGKLVVANDIESVVSG